MSLLIYIALIVSVGLFSLGYSLLEPSTELFQPHRLLFLLSVPFLGYALISSSFLRAIGVFNAQTTLFGLLLPLLAVVLILGYYYFQGDVQLIHVVGFFLISSILVASLVATIWHLTWNQETISLGTIRPDFRMLKGASDFFVISGSQTIIQFSPIIIVGMLPIEEGLSFYYAAFRIALLVSFVLTAGNILIAPLLARAYSGEDREAFVDLSRLSSAVGLLFGLPLAGFLFIFGGDVLGFFGPSYGDALPILRVLLFGQLVNAASGAVIYVLVMSGNQRAVARLNVAALLVSLLGGVVFVSKLGSMGAALTSTLVLVFINFAGLVAVRRLHGFLIFPKFGIVALARMSNVLRPPR